MTELANLLTGAAARQAPARRTVDVALSAFGLIFAPRPEVALTQLRCWYPAAGWPHRVDRRWLYRRASPHRQRIRAPRPSGS
jgi:hypothetical protein